VARRIGAIITVHQDSTAEEWAQPTLFVGGGSSVSGGSKIAQEAQELALPVVEALGLELVEVEYKKEGPEWYLRFYIDKTGGVGIEDCQLASKALDPLLDEKLTIPGRYNLEVSSPGLERPFKTERDFLRNLGIEVEASLFQAKDGKKKFDGVLKDYRDGKVWIEDAKGATSDLTVEEISKIHKAVRFK